MNTRSFVTMLLPVLLLSSLSGCKDLLGASDDVQRTELRNAEARWQAAGIQSYEFVLLLNCACGDPDELRNVRVRVENGVPVSRTYESEPFGPAPEAIFGPYDTAEELFSAVRGAIGREADLLNVVYHSTYGVPLLLQLDPDVDDPDDHLAFQVTGFESATTS